MPDWIPISDDAPKDRELRLWLRAQEGEDKPIGEVVASYRSTDFFTGWHEKSVSGSLNTGLRADLITHYQLMGKGPEDEAVRLLA